MYINDRFPFLTSISLQLNLLLCYFTFFSGEFPQLFQSFNLHYFGDSDQEKNQYLLFLYRTEMSNALCAVIQLFVVVEKSSPAAEGAASLKARFIGNQSIFEWGHFSKCSISVYFTE